MCNEYKHKPMPFGCKVRKLLCNAYYLRKDLFNEMIQDLEHETPTHTVVHTDEHGGTYTMKLTDMQFCVWFVDTYGEWLDS